MDGTTGRAHQEPSDYKDFIYGGGAQDHPTTFNRSFRTLSLTELNVATIEKGL